MDNELDVYVVSPASIRAAAKEAWALLAAEKVQAHLVGTAALFFHGYELAAVPNDVDFLCETMPAAGETLPLDPEYKDGDTSREMLVDGVRVNFILAGDVRAPFLSPEPDIIDGVPVAPVAYVIALKKRAGRPKDAQFFSANPVLDF